MTKTTKDNSCSHKMKKLDVVACRICAKVFVDGIFSPTLTNLFCFKTKGNDDK